MTALRQSTVFLARQARCPILYLASALPFLCLREIRHLGFTFRKIFTSKVRNNLAEPLEINTFKGNQLKAISNGLPCFSTPHELPKMSISVRTQRSGSDPELRSDTVRCFS